MAEPVVDAPTEILSFLGEHNTKHPRRLPLGALTESKNIDVTDTGKIVKRNGIALSKALSNCTWAYSSLDEKNAFLIDSGTLYKIAPDLTLLTIATDVSTEDTFQTEVGDTIYTSSGLVIRGTTVTNLRVPNPMPPTVSVVAGTLPIGIYQVVVTHLDGDLESGHSVPISIELTSVGGIQVTASVSGYTSRIYITKVDGTSFFFAGQDSATVTDYNVLGYRINDVLKNTFPAPANLSRVAYYESKLFCSWFDTEQAITFIFFSKPFHYHLFDIELDNFIVAGEVSLLLAANGVLIIGTEQEVLSYTSENGIEILASYGVPRGDCGVQLKDGSVVFWTLRGMCKAMPFENLTQETVSVPSGDYCATAHIEQNGYDKFIALTDTGGVSNNQIP